MLEIRLAACAAMLVLASIMDIKKREISDKVWVGFGALGLLITGIEFFNNSINILQYAIGIAITTPIGYGIYRSGLFGGADAKALIAIAILVPFYDMPYKIHGLPSFTILTNATVLTFTHVIHNVVRNSLDIARGKRVFEGFEESGLRKAAAFVMGFRASSPKGYLFAIESMEKGKRKFDFHFTGFDDYVASDSKNLWVTPALPFIVYMTVGFLLTVIFGDILAMIFTNMF
jgi:preflagellin peptidase FlaK